MEPRNPRMVGIISDFSSFGDILQENNKVVDENNNILLVNRNGKILCFFCKFFFHASFYR